MLKENSREVEDSLWEFDGSNRKFSENPDINITPLPIFTRWRECQRCSHSTHFHFASPFLAPLHPVTPMVEFQFTQKRVLFSMQIKHNASTFNYFQFSQTYHMHAAHTHTNKHTPHKHSPRNIKRFFTMIVIFVFTNAHLSGICACIIIVLFVFLLSFVALSLRARLRAPQPERRIVLRKERVFFVSFQKNTDRIRLLSSQLN